MKTQASAAKSIDLTPGVANLCHRLETNAQTGLSDIEAGIRLARFGYNEITTKDKFVYLKTFFRQFQSAVVLLLLVAQTVSFLAGEVLQAIAILFALMVNAIIGFTTEIRARISIKSLEDMMKPNTRVLRDGREDILPARLLVPGDIILLSAGDSVPADIKLIESADLRLDESALSGESFPVFKMVANKHNKKFDSDQNQDEVFQGTIVQTGRGRGVVYATGSNTKIGKLGNLLLAAEQNQTPLEHSLDSMGAQLSKLIVVSCVILFVIGVIHDEKPWTMVQVCIALAVAAIPEGMPVIATLALAAGTRKMARNGALVRKLPAVETLGCTDIICSDKTGTLTENQMMVSDIVTFQHHIKLEGSGYEPIGKLFDPEECSPENSSIASDSFMMLMRAAALCNDATLENHNGEVKWHIHGDPTEGALLTAAVKAGLNLNELNQGYERIFEIPFSLERKMMSTTHQSPEGAVFVFTKGSPEAIFNSCQTVANNKSIEKFSPEVKEWFIKKNHEMANDGLRVLAFAFKRLSPENSIQCEEISEGELTLLGLTGMSDQIRPQVSEAIENCRQAGIKIIMVTGDQARTAKAIALKLKIHDGNVLSGKDIESMSDVELKLALEHTRVLARTTPEIKMRVVRMLQETGSVVAMTGDGVNDAPALRQADVGIAMGKDGTHLAREACDLILTDDNFATIVHAVREGRIVYANIRKSIAYLLTASFSSVLVVAFNVLFHCGFYLSPIQLLWLNLIMHIFPGLALALERTDPSIMKLPPRRKEEPLLSRSTIKQIWIRSLFVASLVSCTAYSLQYALPSMSVSLGFAFLSLLLLAQAWSWIYYRENGFSIISKLPRKTTSVCMATSYLFLISALYIPGLNTILGLRALESYWLLGGFFIAWLATIIMDFTIKLVQQITRKKRLPCA